MRQLPNADGEVRVLEVGVGTGCISPLLLLSVQTRVYAIQIFLLRLSLATRNRDALDLQSAFYEATGSAYPRSLHNSSWCWCPIRLTFPHVLGAGGTYLSQGFEPGAGA